MTIQSNTIYNITSAGYVDSSHKYSAKGIYLGDSSGSSPISTVTIDDNTIYNIISNSAIPNGRWGAYGILVNRQTTGLQITNNNIHDLEGLWAHAIGLEGDTPTAVLSTNTISSLVDHKTPSDAFAIYFESNASKNTVSLNGVILGDTSTVVVDDDWAGYANNPVVSVDGHDYIFGVNAFAAVQNGISAVSADGTVNVAAGTYIEALYIDKELTLTGAGRDITTIQAPTVLPSYAWNSGVNSLVAIDTTTVDISGFKIDGLHKGDGGNQFVGVHFWKSSGSIKDSKITGFRDSTLGGNQDGFGILVNHDWDVNFLQNVDIFNNIIDDYQKGGIVITELNSNATIDNNTVTGQGPTTTGQIAQNGIQIGYGAGGSITNNIVTAHDYTPTSWSASGILLTGTDGVSITSNNVNNNEVGIALSEDEDYGYGGANNSEITLNNVTANQIGIQVEGGTDGNTGNNISLNNISGNTSKGLDNTSVNSVDAINNYWGSTCPDFDTIVSGSVTHTSWYINAGMTMLNSDIDSIFDGVASTLAGQGVVSNIGDVTTCNYTDFSNLSLEKRTNIGDSATALGKITFGSGSAALDLSNSETQTFLQNLGTEMEQSNGRIALDVQTSTEFTNKGAVLVMYNLPPDLTQGQLIVRNDAGTVLDASAVVSGFSQDSVTHDLTFNATHFTQFDIDTGAPTKPVASPGAGDYTSDQSVTLSSSDDLSGVDKIYYTTDGTTPNTTKTEYTGAILVDKDMTIKAIAYDKAGNASDVLEAVYGIAPKISSESTSAGSSSSITINWTTDDLATSRVIYDTVSHLFANPTLDVPFDKYGYANTTDEFDTSPQVTTHSVGLTGLSTGTTYYYRTVSHGSPETVGAEQSFSIACTATKPPTPGSFSLTRVNDTEVKAVWNAIADPVTKYKITWSKDTDTDGDGGGSQTVGKVTETNIGGLELNKYGYYFKVSAINDCITGDSSSVVFVGAGSDLRATSSTSVSPSPTPAVLGASTFNPIGYVEAAGNVPTEELSETVLGANTLTPTPVPTGSVLGAENNGKKTPWWPWLFLLLIPAGWFGYREWKKRDGFIE